METKANITMADLEKIAILILIKTVELIVHTIMLTTLVHLNIRSSLMEFQTT